MTDDTRVLPVLTREEIDALDDRSLDGDTIARLILTVKRQRKNLDWYAAERHDREVQILTKAAQLRGWDVHELLAVLDLMDADVIFSPSDTNYAVLIDGELDVNMNDTFYWGTADCEPITAADAVELLGVFKEFGHDGVAAWVALRCGNVWPIAPGDTFRATFDALTLRSTSQYPKARKAEQSG